MPKKYIIGTRGSLLALTQCGQVKDELEALTGASFELKVITTQGDKIQDKALWQIEGKDFFTKELDEQLIAGKIDMVVHSYKDLGSDRPPEIQLAALTKRQVANDILLIKKNKISELSSCKKLVVGTSSPRRITNITWALNEYIPVSDDCKIETEILRGNVNTRIEKLLNDQYDAIVLAYAGLERLALTEESSKKLEELIKDLDFMIMPIKEFTPAASQGVLAIECLKNRDDSGELENILKTIACEKSLKDSSRERELFRSYGGGCHLPLGIYVNDKLEILRGNFNDERIEIHKDQTKIDKKGPIFIGLPKAKIDHQDIVCDELLEKEAVECELPQNAHLLAASTYGLGSIKKSKTLWSSGLATWKKLASEGHWVNGSHEGFGEEFLDSYLFSKLMKLFHVDIKDNFAVATNDQAKSHLGETYTVYKRRLKEITADYKAQVEGCNSFYWSSHYQYQNFCQKFPSIVEKEHYCGLGKTFKAFKENAIKVTPIADYKVFLEKE